MTRSTLLLFAATLTVLAGCATTAQRIPEPLRAPVTVADDEVPESLPEQRRTRVEQGPRSEVAPRRVFDAARTPVRPGGQPVALALDGVNLTAFIDEVFGNQLGFSLEIDQAVRSKSDLVSLRLVKPEPPNRVYEIAVEVLKSYEVAVVEESGRLRFTVVEGGAVDPPRLLSGRTLPEVPSGQRPIFLVMPLEIADAGILVGQLRSLFAAGASGPLALQMTPMLEANAVMLSGPPVLVEAAMEAAQVLDNAGLREKKSLRITPQYLGVEVLAKELREVLAAQGVSVKGRPSEGGALTFVPVASANSLIVFSESDAALEAVIGWVEVLDQPGDEGAGQTGAYIYEVRHTTAESLRVTAEALIGASAQPSASISAATSAANATERGNAAAPSSRQATVSQGADGSRIVVDPARNAIIFQGDATRWRALRSVLTRLDQPARQVLIEVTVAEVTLTDEFAHGVEWALRNAGISDFGGALSAYSGSVSNRGVVWRPISSSGQVRAVMNLFEDDSRVSILSTPRLMVRSGESASIDVGTEVPILTSQATAPDLGGVTPSILQQVQYRKTGVLLTIEPVVHSSQRVDLKVAQEVSEAQQTESSSISSPSIFSRRLETALTLSDGQAMIMGGLIRDSRSQGGSYVPGLGRIPVLGHLFSSRTRTGDRTELLVLITPYIVEDAAQAQAVTEALRGRMQLIDRGDEAPGGREARDP